MRLKLGLSGFAYGISLAILAFLLKIEGAEIIPFVLFIYLFALPKKVVNATKDAFVVHEDNKYIKALLYVLALLIVLPVVTYMQLWTFVKLGPLMYALAHICIWWTLYWLV